MTLKEFNAQDKAVASDALFTCCSSEKWTALLLKEFPFSSEQSLISSATSIWYNECDPVDWQEAFAHHPKIGDVKGLTEKFGSTAHLASAEQSGVNSASGNVINELASGNKAYEEKFGFVFLVCATGKTAEEMLRLLQDRLQNEKEEEVSIAVGEQHKIMLIRLKKMLHGADWMWMKGSQLTTHVLDTSIGKPGQNITIRLQQMPEKEWRTFSQGVTNADGRIPDLLPPARILPPAIYKMVFETGRYFDDMDVKGFYPRVEIQFSISDDQHYHVPLLVNPFGYSTYRGS